MHSVRVRHLSVDIMDKKFGSDIPLCILMISIFKSDALSLKTEEL